MKFNCYNHDDDKFDVLVEIIYGCSLNEQWLRKQTPKCRLGRKGEYSRPVFLIYLLSLHEVEKPNGFFVLPQHKTNPSGSYILRAQGQQTTDSVTLYQLFAFYVQNMMGFEIFE